MSYSTLLTNLENNILTITINRSDKLNALNKDVFTDLNNVVDEIENTAEIKAAIIIGAGNKAFVAGADIAEFSSYNKEQAMVLAKRGQDVFLKIENCTKPFLVSSKIALAALIQYAIAIGAFVLMFVRIAIAFGNNSSCVVT